MKKTNRLGTGIASGAGIGTAIGVAMDNIGLWIAVGAAIGAGVGTALMQQGSHKQNDGESNESSEQ